MRTLLGGVLAVLLLSTPPTVHTGDGSGSDSEPPVLQLPYELYPGLRDPDDLGCDADFRGRVEEGYRCYRQP
jgi:hypothetical protein